MDVLNCGPGGHCVCWFEVHVVHEVPRRVSVRTTAHHCHAHHTATTPHRTPHTATHTACWRWHYPHPDPSFKLARNRLCRYNAPLVKFVTPCFHPNVDEHGNICLDILKEKWSAAYSVTTVLISLQSLLGEPNNDSPLNNTAAELWDRQIEYKAILLKKYAEDAKKSS